MQAIARSHRLGQLREVKVSKLIMKMRAPDRETVEQRIMQMQVSSTAVLRCLLDINCTFIVRLATRVAALSLERLALKSTWEWGALALLLMYLCTNEAQVISSAHGAFAISDLLAYVYTGRQASDCRGGAYGWYGRAAAAPELQRAASPVWLGTVML